MSFNIKQKRAFQTIISGIRLSGYGNKSIRFLTLTTSLLCKNSEFFEKGSLNNDFQILKKRICRYSPHRLVSEGYISSQKAKSVYRSEKYFKNFNFEYFKVETSEGNGVLHILYRGSYLPYSFLVDNWQTIHNSWDLNIKKIDTSKPKDSALYVVTQYISSQSSSYVRNSQSWNWVFRGFKQIWYKFARDYRSNCIELWEKYLKKYSLNKFYQQKSLSDFG